MRCDWHPLEIDVCRPVGRWRHFGFLPLKNVRRAPALLMLEQILGIKRVTVCGDKGFETADFISECRRVQVTPVADQPRATFTIAV